MELLSKNHLSKVLKYKQKKFIEQDHLILVEGFRLLKQISEYGIVFEELYVTKKNPYNPHNFNYKKIYETPAHYFNKLSNTKTPQYISALIKYNPFSFPKSYNSLIYLDNISDPGNLGTIIRTALSFSFDAVVLSNGSVSFLNEKVIRASLGAIFKIPIFQYDNNWLKNENAVKIIADISKQSIELNKLPIISKPKIIVIGSEAHGISDEIKHNADFSVKIPIENMESLNAAISAAIIMYHFYENSRFNK